MIDVHCHILNNVDDGSDSIECTLQNLEKAEKAGFSDIILTPHYIENYYENKKDIIKFKINELKKYIYDQEILVEVHQGNEILLTENTPQLLEVSEISTLANSRYILFELPFSNKMLDLDQIIYKVKANGFIPILAHPERYSYIQENPSNILEIIKLGVLIQSNYGSFIGQYGKSAKATVEILLKNKLINFLGSDTHKQGNVYENIDIILKRARDLVKDEKYIYEITTSNPNKILNDIDIEINCPEGLSGKSKLFSK
jgi:protein-tyrosine phosphatase